MANNRRNGRGAAANGSGRPRGRPLIGGKKNQNEGLRPEDFEDEIDAFDKERDLVRLDDAEDFSDDEDDEEEAVFDVKGGDDDDDDEDDEDEEEEDEEELTGLAAKMAKQAKYLRQKAGGAAEDDEEDGAEEEGDEEQEDEGAAWGKRKKAYYSADNVDYELQSDDEEMPAEEEKEVLRMQRKRAAALRPEDFGLEEENDEDEDGDEEDEEEEDEEEATMLETLAKGEKAGTKSTSKSTKGAEGTKAGGEKEKVKAVKQKKAARKAVKEMGGEVEAVAVEEVQKDLSALSTEEQMAVVMSDAPELVGLLDDLKKSLDELRTKVEPLLAQVKAGDYATAKGLSYLEAKHLLLLHYCSAIVFYLLLRAEGRPVRDHPVIARLVELRLYLEKIRPIDKKLEYQIDKLLKAGKAAGDTAATDGKGGAAAGVGGRGAEQELAHRPHPDMLVSKLDEQPMENGTAGVYRPPMMVPAAMEDESKSRDSRSKQRAEREARKRAVRSSFVREMAAELEGRPEEVAAQETMRGASESREMQRERERLQARARDEEELFARVPLSRAEKTQLKSLTRNRNSMAGILDDLDDDVGDIVRMEEAAALTRGAGEAEASGLPPEGLLKRKKISQAIAEAGRVVKKTKVLSGDADIPAREDLGERRRAHEMKGLKQQQKSEKGGKSHTDFDDDEGGNDDDNEDVGDFDEEDFGGRRKGSKSGKRERQSMEAFGGGGEEDEDDFYKAAKQKRAEKLAVKKAMYSREDVEDEGGEEDDDDEDGGKRSITREMTKNRGLTPHRNKLVRNPRKKYKVKHAKAVVRRKGQFRDVQQQTAPYGGQVAGIKANVSHSVRL
eukprot:TRINITY_DN13573_c0_g1_i1.p1 TRINITY_DN13573_c0_g1~~TRINITY_DN13573_c0_g1_i1.p1  ORF type:complete len:875 (-),score=338.73 TRINITY_DN13573_c0_g1_i1:369-2879(-)